MTEESVKQALSVLYRLGTLACWDYVIKMLKGCTDDGFKVHHCFLHFSVPNQIPLSNGNSFNYSIPDGLKMVLFCVGIFPIKCDTN